MTKRILLTASRFPVTLDLARQLHAAGHEVYTADSLRYPVCRFSNAVKKNFQTPSPREQPKEYIEALLEIVAKYQIDLLVPTFEDILYVAKEKEAFPAHCKLFCSSYETLQQLHNKWLFYKKLQKHGFPTLPTVLCHSEEDLVKTLLPPPYVLKSCFSRASQSLFRVDNIHKIPNIAWEKSNPLIAQQWAEGSKYCTYSVCNNGKVKAHVTYPVEYAIDGNSCISFKAIRHEKISEFVTRICEKEQFTGQIAFDFIQSEDGTLYCIECNPRSTSGIHLFQKTDRIADAFLNENKEIISPKEGSRRQIAIGMLIWGWRKGNSPYSLWNFLKRLFSTKDVVLSPRDLKPFLLEPLLFSSYYVRAIWNRVSLPSYFTYDFSWNGEQQKD